MIRIATNTDIKRIIEIYDIAKDFMRKSGNLNQWTNGYPGESDVLNDIKNNNLYVIELDNKIEAVFAMLDTPEPTYKVIEGSWITNNEYMTIHRIASTGVIKNVFSLATDFALKHKKTVRVDTHKDNIPMQRAILKRGYKYCGIITLKSGDTRLAYEIVENYC